MEQKNSMLKTVSALFQLIQLTMLAGVAGMTTCEAVELEHRICCVCCVLEVCVEEFNLFGIYFMGTGFLHCMVWTSRVQCHGF